MSKFLFAIASVATVIGILLMFNDMRMASALFNLTGSNSSNALFQLAVALYAGSAASALIDANDRTTTP